MKGLVERGNRYNGFGKGRFDYLDISKMKPFCLHFENEMNTRACNYQSV